MHKLCSVHHIHAGYAVYLHAHIHIELYLRCRRVESKELIKNYHKMIAINTLTLYISHMALETTPVLGDMW